ncbi:glycoside hydrolase family 28 protein [Fistulina hepatica ATCC 64428]|uniref:galacturonan 1,4-alpha-galacturonidase n=1 Tax=Fistulina hepatica ATCC 64428 TaxID=1128425 RepID=A0A0D7A5U8_9AGAR|nr:glycoside hydrolase family 28 protein [Fistulina hepatica ATCC 64428]
MVSPLLSSVLLFGVVAAAHSVPTTRCTLTSSGGDDASAFVTAASSCATVTIPADTTLKISSKMDMTGLKGTHIDLQGTIKFNDNIDYWAGNSFYFEFQDSYTFWLLGGKDITLDGGGTIDGSGQAWYDAFYTNSSLVRPITLTVYQAQGATIKDIKMINSPMWFNLAYESSDLLYTDITIDTWTTSNVSISNTDGWDIYRCDNVVVRDSHINNNDDCVSFKPNSTNILVQNLHCNGSQSLGEYAGIYDIVENVTAIDITMSNAQNGARIKAFAGEDVGSGIVKNIVFKNWVESAVENPIIVDQCYETSTTACEDYPSNVYIQDVWFTNIVGTGTESAVASIDCSPDDRCSNIYVNDLHLKLTDGEAGEYECENVVLQGDSASLFNCTDTS